MSLSALRGPLAATVALSLVALTSSAPVSAQSATTLTGRVLAENGVAARAGVVVALVDPSSEKVFRSQPTDERGAFRVEAPSAGRYALVVEAREGAFLAAGGLDLKAGANRPVSLALKPGKQDPGQPPAATGQAAAKGGLPTWAKWVIAGGIVVGAAIVVDAVTSDDEASNF